MDSSGIVIVGGWTYGAWFDQDRGGKDLSLMKYDSDLNLIWGWQYRENDLISDQSTFLMLHVFGLEEKQNQVYFHQIKEMRMDSLLKSNQKNF